MKKLALMISAIALFASGCVLTSINPLFKTSDLISNEALVGEWMGTNSIVTIRKAGQSGYVLNYKDCEDPYNAPQDFSSCTVADFNAYLFKLGDSHYLDLFPRDFLNTENPYLKFHIKANHSFAKIIIEKDLLKVFLFDYGWIQNHLEKNKTAIAHIKSGTSVILTATTEELQNFVLKNQKEPGFFSPPIEMKRK